VALREFLSAHRASILEHTRSRVAAKLASSAPAEELDCGPPRFLDQLIDILGSPSGSSDAIAASATLHGGHLLRRGFTVAQVVHDYGGLCQAITELAAQAKAPITVEEFHTLNRCLDDAVAQAVTEFTEQREQAIAADARQNLGELAHELRNSLGSAMISFDVLKTGRLGFGGGTATVLAASLKRLSSLIDSSAAGVRLDSGLRAPERVSLREFIEEVEVGAEMEANARGATLTVTPFGRGIDAEVDRALLAAAVANLLNNAFKFGRRGGHVSLRASATEGRAFIEVEDECGGLPQGETESLFRPFERQNANRTGLGLGLSISRKSIEADGGELRVRNLPGVGCVFTIDLPRLPPAV
jgi:signal transduction histidine kinase